LANGTFTSTAPATMSFGTNGLATGTVTARTTLGGSATVATPLGNFTANRVDITLGTLMNTTINNGGVIGATTGQFTMTERYTFYVVPNIGIVRAVVNISQSASSPGNFPTTSNMSYTASLFSYTVA
jgi:hypothetical protein